MGYREARIVCAGLAVAMLAMGCVQQSPGEPQHPPAQPSLQDSSWRLEALGPAGDLRRALTATDVTLAFTGDARITGNASCNTYFGGYLSGEDGTLSVTGLGSTKMFCHEPGVMQQEQDFLNALQGAKRYEVVDGLLHITGGDVEMVLSPA